MVDRWREACECIQHCRSSFVTFMQYAGALKMNLSHSIVVDAVYPNGSLVRPPTPGEDGIGCSFWRPPNHVLYHCANAALVIGLLAPKKKFGNLFLHSMFVLGFLLLSVWAWTILCAPDIFSWNFAFMVVNVLQMLFLMYYIRPIKFTGELENLYVTMFEPMKVSRKLFKKLVCPDFCSIGMLHEGEPYAIHGVSRTERLGLLLTGMMKVYSHKNILHSIREYEFIDSPEFESSMTGEEKYQVSIIADCTCRYVYWPRHSLEYLLLKEPFLATVMNTMIGYDITNKLYALNDRVAEKNGGCHQDIRLPGVASMLKSRRASHKSSTRSGSHGNQQSAQPLQLHHDEKGNVKVDFEDDEEMDIIEDNFYFREQCWDSLWESVATRRALGTHPDCLTCSKCTSERVGFLNGHIPPSMNIDCSSNTSECSGIHFNI